MQLTTTNIITIIGLACTIILAIFLALRKGDIKKIEVYFTPSRLKRRAANNLFFIKGKPIPAVGVINFIKLPTSKHRRICYHIYLTIENLSKHDIEDVSVILTYPRKYFDENDKHFFENAGKGSKREFSYTLIDDETIQVEYSYSSLHPRGLYQIIHPIIISIAECFDDLDFNNPLFFDIAGKGFSFDQFGYIVSAKNLSKPIRSSFWVINSIQLPFKEFFNREKKFLHTITKDYKFDRYIFEQRDIEIYKEGKYKKDVLVVPADKVKISYSHFPPLKQPNNQLFNFEQSEDA